jgi:hypothetical protein
MLSAAVLWCASAVVILAAAWRSRRHVDAVRVGRYAFAFLFLVGGAATNAAYLVGGEDYGRFADGAPIPFVRHTWVDLVVPHHVAWIALLIAFEVAVGLLALAGGARTQLAYALAIAFHLGLLFFGWGFFLWAVPMIAAYAALLRGERRLGAGTAVAAPRPSADAAAR